VIVANRLWRNRLGADPGIIGGALAGAVILGVPVALAT
jgi:hypothetical protein